MSHFVTLVLTETGDEEEVARLLAPYDENGEWFADGSRWDWWVIGGRWNGWLIEDYDPIKDERNYELCPGCAGTKTRLDGLSGEGNCNYCAVGRTEDGSFSLEGTGRALKWNSEWADPPEGGNVAPVKGLQLPGMPFAVVTPDGKWHERARMGWFGATVEDEDANGEKPEVLWEAAVKALLEQWPDSVAVVVDCHV